jgi:short subunit fatty acids transporter
MLLGTEEAMAFLQNLSPENDYTTASGNANGFKDIQTNSFNTMQLFVGIAHCGYPASRIRAIMRLPGGGAM